MPFSTNRPFRFRWHWLALAAVGIGVGGACGNPSNPDVLGNGSGNDPDATTGVGACAPGHQGCPCNDPGQTAACGTLVHDYGSYVTCQPGTSTCVDGTWGACAGGTTMVHRSLHSVTYTPLGGIKITQGVVSTGDGGTCPSDPCDPNACTVTTDGPGDLPDGAPLIATEGGITLPPIGGTLDGGGGGTTCSGLQCQVDWSCNMASRTTLTGIVYDPVMQNPLYNAYVYIPVDPNPANLPAFSSGASCNACSGTTLNAVAVAQTDVNGKFTLSNVPTTAMAPGNPIPLVVQMGKWRRVQMLTSVPDCTSTTVPPASSRLPRSKFDGYNNTADIPRMAIASGSADPFECMMLKMGIDPAEFQLPGAGSRRIDFYQANGLQYQGGGAPAYSQLVGSLAALTPYDVVLLPCEGTQDEGNENYSDFVAKYTLAGGRMFTTHYGYTWLADPSGGTANATNPVTGKPNIFYPVATWDFDDEANSATGQIDTGFPKGATFETWMDQLPAPNNGVVTTGAFTINSPRHDLDKVNTSYATEWMHDTSWEVPKPLHFTFNTPLGAGVGDAGADAGAGVCGRVVYSDFHVSTADIIGNNPNCTTNADCGYGSTCTPGTVGTCTPVACASVSDCPDNSYTCLGGGGGAVCGEPAQQCQRNRDCYGNGTCNGSNQCTCASSSDCGGSPCVAGICGNSGTACSKHHGCVGNEVCQTMPGTCTHACNVNSDCTGGELCVSNKCTGCSSQNNCPSQQCNGATQGSCSGNSGQFPNACSQGPLDAQESALEFMLLDLTACVSPDNQPPPPPSQPVTTYSPATFTVDFTSSCPTGTHVRWTELDWQDSIPAAETDGATPSGSSIVFVAQTADPAADGGAPNYTGVQSVTVATATQSTNGIPAGTLGKNMSLIDTSPNDGGAGAGVFNKASPMVTSKGDLRLTITLNPSTDKLEAPTLISWQVKADCPPTE